MMPTLTDNEIAIRSGFMNKAILEIRTKHNLYAFGIPAIPAKEISGSMKCSKCGGELNYVISSYNGHIHGSCSKNDEKMYSCLDWSE